MPRLRQSNLIVLLVATIMTFLLGYMVANTSDDWTSSSVSKKNMNSHNTKPNLIEWFDSIQSKSRFVRNFQSLKLFSSATQIELENYWEQSFLISNQVFRADIQSSVIQRLAALDPRYALTVVKNETDDSRQPELIEIVFREWSIQNLNEALVVASSLDQTGLEVALRSILQTRDDLTFSENREIARQFDLEWIAFEILSQLSNSTFDAPDEEWYRFVNYFDEFNVLSTSELHTLSYITYFWILRDGVAVVDSMMEILPADFLSKSMIEFIAHKLLSNQAELATNFLAALINRVDEKCYEDLALELFESWDRSWPVLALEATMKIEKQLFRRELQAHILEILAQDDEFDLLARVSILPADLHGLAVEVYLSEATKVSPENVSIRLADIVDIERRTRIAESVAANWANRDIQKTLDWIQTDSSVSRFRENLLETALKALAVRNPDLALKTALELPLNTENLGWEGTVFSELMFYDSETAISMLPKMRAGNTRRAAYDVAILNLSLRENDLTRALDLLIELSELEPTRINMQSSIAVLVKNGPREIFKLFDDIPYSTAGKADLANALLSEYKDSAVFSQIELYRLENIVQNRALPDVSQEFIDATNEYYRLLQELETE